MEGSWMTIAIDHGVIKLRFHTTPYVQVQSTELTSQPYSPTPPPFDT